MEKNLFSDRALHFAFTSFNDLIKEYIDDNSIKEKYANCEKEKKILDEKIEKTLLFSLKFLASVKILKDMDIKNIRILLCASIPCWYYGVHYAALSFVYAYNLTPVKQHTALMSQLASDNISKELLFPFNMNVNIFCINDSLNDICEDINNKCSENIDLEYYKKNKGNPACMPKDNRDKIMRVLQSLETTARKKYNEKKDNYKKDKGIIRLAKEKEDKWVRGRKPKNISFFDYIYNLRTKVHYSNAEYSIDIEKNNPFETAKGHKQAQDLLESLYNIHFVLLRIAIYILDKKYELSSFKKKIDDDIHPGVTEAFYDLQIEST